MDEVIITATDKVEYDLDTLVGSIDTQNIHDEVSFGAPVGKEARWYLRLMFQMRQLSFCLHLTHEVTRLENQAR